MSISSIRKRLTVANMLNGVFIVLVLIVFFNPSAKALLIRGLMQVGLFQPDISQPIKTTNNTSLPNITFQNTNGQILNLSDQKGKVIFINFWATWCPPCIAEMPSVNELYEKLQHNKNIVFIMVDADHDFNKSVPFMNKHQFTLPLYEANSEIPENLLSGSIPITVIFDKKGQLVFHHEGAGDYSSAKFADYLLKLSR
ncbi:TlpA family protein disulfide reductase [Mucilaginibacter sp. HC2]|jgi:thiol-disulfide isomerase/thioredoxin|uniref:Redoxin domain-containing protein n=1 Tax=Mucilaginibacter agri TaxID=2695265 RepID=A0A965ZCK0_9SPHI|nr:TlpA disulfide reductase family protein [Mucilaginibacter inviolabilis]NCD67798.1 redoxin domain-containing protein [Mucilaginibacter agri]NHA05794.1 TlpA family protein disulfide reductase [Mucilaginibacter inviolabilis]